MYIENMEFQIWNFTYATTNRFTKYRKISKIKGDKKDTLLKILPRIHSKMSNSNRKIG